jgi:hypothetical protein
VSGSAITLTMRAGYRMHRPRWVAVLLRFAPWWDEQAQRERELRHEKARHDAVMTRIRAEQVIKTYRGADRATFRHRR